MASLLHKICFDCTKDWAVRVKFSTRRHVYGITNVSMRVCEAGEKANALYEYCWLKLRYLPLVSVADHISIKCRCAATIMPSISWCSRGDDDKCL